MAHLAVVVVIAALAARKTRRVLAVVAVATNLSSSSIVSLRSKRGNLLVGAARIILVVQGDGLVTLVETRPFRLVLDGEPVVVVPKPSVEASNFHISIGGCETRPAVGPRTTTQNLPPLLCFSCLRLRLVLCPDPHLVRPRMSSKDHVEHGYFEEWFASREERKGTTERMVGVYPPR